MLVLNNIWVNWFEGEDKGYNVCPFYEWRRKDKIQLIDEIPLLYLEHELYDYIENNLDDLPREMLETIQNRTISKGRPIEYAAVVTDGRGVIVFDTLGYSIPLKKSRLIPNHERKALQSIQAKSKLSFSFKKTPHTNSEHIFSLSAQAMIGLNRRERELKQLTMLVLDQLKVGNNLNEIHYWLTEWEPEAYQTIRKLSFQPAWERLYHHLYYGWTEQHETFCQKIIKGQPLFEQLWDKANEVNDEVIMKRIK